MKRTFAIILTALTALTATAFTGCGGKDSSAADSASGQAAGSAAEDQAESAAPAGNAESTAEKPAVITDGSKCGVLQKAAEQDAFELKGLILTTGSGHHDYPAIAELIRDGYKTEGLYSTYVLGEWIEVYGDCDKPVSIYVVPNQADTDYAAMTEADLIKISDDSQYPNVATDLTPDKEDNGHLTNFYVHQELDAGLYNVCFVSDGKLCYLVQLNLMPEPQGE